MVRSNKNKRGITVFHFSSFAIPISKFESNKTYKQSQVELNGVKFEDRFQKLITVGALFLLSLINSISKRVQ